MHVENRSDMQNSTIRLDGMQDKLHLGNADINTNDHVLPTWRKINQKYLVSSEARAWGRRGIGRGTSAATAAASRLLQRLH